MTRKTKENPLVTFAVFAYNQEKYIREAIEGAFAQSYEPLDIILSDDCSSDRTFEIMQEMAKAYNGPHEVRVRRSEVNKGLGDHINSVVKMVKTDWIVVAAGDDVSMPYRTQHLMRSLNSTTQPPSLLHSAAIKISEQGAFIEIYQNKFIDVLADTGRTIEHRAYVLGATVAWHRSLFDNFEKLPENLMYEDQVLQVRAQLCDGIGYITDPLVHYRAGGVTSKDSRMNLYEKVFGESNERWSVARDQQVRDLLASGGDPEAVNIARRHRKLCQFRSEIRGARTYRSRMLLALKYAHCSGQSVEAVKHLCLACFPGFSEFAFKTIKIIARRA